MWLTSDEQPEAFWSYQDLLIFLGLAVPCLLGGALLMKAALLVFYLSVPNKALELLQKVYDDRSESVVWLKIDPTFDNLRGDPRFVALVRKAGL